MWEESERRKVEEAHEKEAKELEDRQQREKEARDLVAGQKLTELMQQRSEADAVAARAAKEKEAQKKWVALQKEKARGSEQQTELEMMER